MKDFKKVLKDVSWSLTEISLFDALVDSTIIFLLTYLIFSFFSLHILFSLMPAAAYFIVYTHRAVKKSKPAIVESKHEPLKEKFRTAADNVEYENPILDELEYDVTSEIKKVGLSLFVNPKVLSYKIFLATFLSFLIIFVSSLNIKFEGFSLNKAPDIFERKNKGSGDFTATKLETSDDIYGDKDIAKLGDNELNIKIRPVDFRVSVKEEGDFEKREFETIFPKDVYIKESAAFEENIAQENQELVKNYFKKLALS